MPPWSGAQATRWAGSVPRKIVVSIGGLAALIGLPLIGYLASSHELYALGIGAVLLLFGVLVIDIRFLAVLAIPCTLIVLRAGGASGLSVSDLVLFMGTLCALTVFRLRDAPEVRSLLWLLAIYQATTVLTVVDNFYRSNLIEWIHEAFLVGGSIIVGWVVAYAGRAKAAVTAYMLGSCFIALWACLQTLTHGLSPAYLPGGMQKNYIGDMLAFGALLAYTRPSWIGWRSRVWPWVGLIVCLLGIIASQSKQAMIALAFGILFMQFRSRGMGRRSRLIFLALIPMLIIAFDIVSSEITSHNRFNSVYTRLSAYSDSIHVWSQSPLVGVGLRWWYLAAFQPAIQPPNAELEMLTSAGLIGLMGFFVLFFGALAVLRKVPKEFGTLALAVLLMRLLQGQLDLFWVAAQGSLPWMLVGLVLGVVALERRRSPRLNMPPAPPLYRSTDLVSLW